MLGTQGFCHLPGPQHVDLVLGHRGVLCIWHLGVHAWNQGGGTHLPGVTLHGVQSVGLEMGLAPVGLYKF